MHLKIPEKNIFLENVTLKQLTSLATTETFKWLGEKKVRHQTVVPEFPGSIYHARSIFLCLFCIFSVAFKTVFGPKTVTLTHTVLGPIRCPNRDFSRLNDILYRRILKL